jgi:POT family proton-dependent oligopeptide transporter
MYFSVGLSYVSKLVPAKWIGIMFGVYYLFMNGNKIAGSMGGMIRNDYESV